jgi:hypothetical protein
LKQWFTPWKPLTVWFNAWRHEQEEALWAAFALRFLKQVSSQRNWFRRQVGNFHLFWQRFKWKEGWLDLLHKSLLSILAISVVIIIPVWAFSDPQYWVNELREVAKALSDKDALQNIFTKGIQVGGIVTYVVFLLFFFKKLKEFFGNLLEIDLKKYLQAPNYQNRRMEQWQNCAAWNTVLILSRNSYNYLLFCRCPLMMTWITTWYR